MMDWFVDLDEDDMYFMAAALVSLVIIILIARNYRHHVKFAGRVKVLQERRAALRAQLMVPRKRAKKTVKVNVGWMKSVVSKLNLLQKSQVGKISKLLINAGYRSKDAIFIFTFLQLVLPIISLAVAPAVLGIDFQDPLAVKWKLFAVVGAGFVGLKLPSFLVVNKRNKRYAAMQRGLADTLDLMMICAEAGLSLAAALDRVARELANTYPEMAEELSMTSIELGFLPDRKKALVNLSERVDMPEIRNITNVLIQTEKYGTPVAQALRVLAAEFREQRMLRAEQKAARLPAIMTIPMIVFILPTLFIVLLTPAIIGVLNNFKH